jgi:hypothetical protein
LSAFFLLIVLRTPTLSFSLFLRYLVLRGEFRHILNDNIIVFFIAFGSVLQLIIIDIFPVIDLTFSMLKRKRGISAADKET